MTTATKEKSAVDTLQDEVFSFLSQGTTKASIVATHVGLDKVKVLPVLRQLRAEGKVECSGRGRGATWFVVE